MNDAADEFFDVPEPTDDDNFKHDWPTGDSSEYLSRNIYQTSRLSSAAGLVKKLQDLRDKKRDSWNYKTQQRKTHRTSTEQIFKRTQIVLHLVVGHQLILLLP